MTDFFISYNTKDEGWANWIASKLREQGHSTIHQAWDFRPGQDFVLKMQQAVTQSKKTIAVLSEDYLTSLYTQLEWASAVARDPIGADRTLLPVRVADCRPQGVLASRIWADLVGLDEPEAAKKLIDLLRECVEPELAPPFPGNNKTSARTKGLQSVPFPGKSLSSQSLIQDPFSPRFLDEHTQLLSAELKQAHVRQRSLAIAGESTIKVDEEIKDLKRKLRHGGQLKPGDQLADGRYLLIASLGYGGFATVWKAKDNELNCHVAIKVLHTQLAHHITTRERFFRGSRIMVDLSDSDGVVSVMAPHGEDDGYYYFVMEIVDGGNLYEAVRHRSVTPNQAVEMMDHILGVLMKAHGHPNKYVHRDIKPTNILLTLDGRLKLTDFDLAWADDTTGGTRSGMLGTFGYAAPEQLNRPQAADHRADIYGVAVTGLFVLSGGEIDHFAIFRDPWSIIDRLPINEQVKQVLLKAMEPNPEDRFGSAEEFRIALRDGRTLGSLRKRTRKRRTSKEKALTTPKQKKRYTIPDFPVRKVHEAFEMFDRDYRNQTKWLRSSSNPKHRYAINYEGKLYPVKLVVSLATGIPTGHFSGGVSLNQSITDMGFNVIPLRPETLHSDTEDDSADPSESKSSSASISE